MWLSVNDNIVYQNVRCYPMHFSRFSRTVLTRSTDQSAYKCSARLCEGVLKGCQSHVYWYSVDIRVTVFTPLLTTQVVTIASCLPESDTTVFIASVVQLMLNLIYVGARLIDLSSCALINRAACVAHKMWHADGCVRFSNCTCSDW